MIEFANALAGLPLVAILRGIQPEEVDAIGDTLVEAGFAIIEVPLNSPSPYVSIERLAKRLGQRAAIGAGTVLTVADVGRVRDAGGTLAISPNVDPDVIAASVRAGLTSIPGYSTPSEAFAGLKSGAHALKLFPAEAASPTVLKAQRAVLPRSAPILVVGGITPQSLASWRAAGADGFGLGSALYRAGAAVGDVRRAATAFVDAWRAG